HTGNPRAAVAHWRRRATIWDAKSGNCCMAHDGVHTVFSSGLARIKKPEKRSSEFSAFATPLAAASRQTKSKRGNQERLMSKFKSGSSLQRVGSRYVWDDRHGHYFLDCVPLGSGPDSGFSSVKLPPKAHGFSVNRQV